MATNGTRKRIWRGIGIVLLILALKIGAGVAVWFYVIQPYFL